MVIAVIGITIVVIKLCDMCYQKGFETGFNEGLHRANAEEDI